MTTEPVRVLFHLEPLLPLISVLGSAVQFQAINAGFKTETSARIASASEDVCREALSQLTDADGGLEIALDTFADRMEVSILHGGQALPAVGLDTFISSSDHSAGADGINGLELLSRVDRVIYKNENGKVRTTLVKFLKS
jgi:hypothetical protein